ncbi:MAG TPA: outer membrane beta-barrel protein, partial [Nitrosomonas sp.]|nr:outer membrane beta-barrel protein [Nitrosomonas sp.]
MEDYALVAHRKMKKKGLVLAVCSAFFVSSLVHAETKHGHESLLETPEDTGLVESLTGYKYNESSFMKALGVKFGGWTEIGFAGNTGTSKSSHGNGPVTFNDGPNEFKLHQVYGFIEREVDTTSNSINFGFRADLLYGTDARFTTASNFDTNILDSDNQRKLAFPQAYVDVFLPIGNGITATM